MSGDICEICNAEIIHAGPIDEGGWLVVVFAPGVTSSARTTVCGGCIIDVAKAGVKLLTAPPPFDSDPTPPAPAPTAAAAAAAERIFERELRRGRRAR